MGIAPRRLDGWSPKSVVEHVYDEDGRLVRSVEFTETEFSQEDVARLVAARRIRNAPRGPHGHLISEATSAEANPSSRAAKFRYVVQAPSRDFAQQAINRAQEEWKNSHPDTDMSDLIFTADRVPVMREEATPDS
ncbi:hypothetical protein [Microbacterium sp. GXF6406]